MDSANHPNNTSKSIIIAANPSGENYYPGSSGLRGFLANERNEVMMNSDSIREAMIQREMEKERIRREILVLDMMRKTELEAEVRRELAIEEMALRRGDSFPLNGGPSPLPPWCDRPTRVGYGIPERFPEPRLMMLDHPIGVSYGITNRHPEPRLVNLDRPIGASLIGRLPEPRLASQDQPMGVNNLTHKLPSATQAESDVSLPFQRNPEATKILERNKAQLKDVAKPYSALVGKKRKPEPIVVNDSSGSSSKKNPQEWMCTICNVNATSKKNLEMHLQGKKHQAKAQAEEASKITGGSSVGKGVTSGISKKRKKRETEAERKLRIVELKKRFKFCCLDCGVGCHTKIVLMRHCKGSKHAAQIAKLAGGTSSTVEYEEEVKINGQNEDCTKNGTESTGEVGEAGQ